MNSDSLLDKFSITKEYWNSIPLSDKFSYLNKSMSGDLVLPVIKDEQSLLLLYERAMKERNHRILSLLHGKCFSLKLLPLASRYDDLVTLNCLLEHRKPEKNNPYLRESLLCAQPLSFSFLTSYIRGQIPS
ncbi:hypothetical protein [Cedratvirus kamchatka]|uniref:Uncharacterized protein n=1 Tax=Cedratvirus kamchatka TaxID=2716914 RepID=A0A6G8MY71_9VIRU|nr:hypothetical protein [Cedratvirus kamchatka]